jgi:GST-like protein
MIDLYMWGTSNGLRASLALAESGLDHRIHKVDLTKGEQKKPEFLVLNPAGQIPVMVDTDGPNGARLVLAQSAAILLYAAEKSGKFMPNDGVRRAAAWQWFMMGSSDLAGTSATLFLLENLAPEKSLRNAEFFKDRLFKLFSLLDQRLSGREFVADELSIADLMLYPIYATRKPFIDAAGGFANLHRWGAMMASRASVQKGMNP